MKTLIAKIRDSENLGPFLTALAVGLAGGLGAIVFRFLIRSIDHLFFTQGRGALPFLGDYAVILFPVVGLVLVSLIVRRWAPEAQGHGS